MLGHKLTPWPYTQCRVSMLTYGCCAQQLCTSKTQLAATLVLPRTGWQPIKSLWKKKHLLTLKKKKISWGLQQCPVSTSRAKILSVEIMAGTFSPSCAICYFTSSFWSVLMWKRIAHIVLIVWQVLNKRVSEKLQRHINTDVTARFWMLMVHESKRLKQFNFLNMC